MLKHGHQLLALCNRLPLWHLEREGASDQGWAVISYPVALKNSNNIPFITVMENIVLRYVWMFIMYMVTLCVLQHHCLWVSRCYKSEDRTFLKKCRPNFSNTEPVKQESLFVGYFHDIRESSKNWINAIHKISAERNIVFHIRVSTTRKWTIYFCKPVIHGVRAAFSGGNLMAWALRAGL